MTTTTCFQIMKKEDDPLQGGQWRFLGGGKNSTIGGGCGSGGAIGAEVTAGTDSTCRASLCVTPTVGNVEHYGLHQ